MEYLRSPVVNVCQGGGGEVAPGRREESSRCRPHPASGQRHRRPGDDRQTARDGSRLFTSRRSPQRRTSHTVRARPAGVPAGGGGCQLHRHLAGVDDPSTCGAVAEGTPRRRLRRRRLTESGRGGARQPGEISSGDLAEAAVVAAEMRHRLDCGQRPHVDRADARLGRGGAVDLPGEARRGVGLVGEAVPLPHRLRDGVELCEGAGTIDHGVRTGIVEHRGPGGRAAPLVGAQPATGDRWDCGAATVLDRHTVTEGVDVDRARSGSTEGRGWPVRSSPTAGRTSPASLCRFRTRRLRQRHTSVPEFPVATPAPDTSGAVARSSDPVTIQGAPAGHQSRNSACR